MDGTLVDTMPLHFQSWQQVAKERGFTFSEELFYALAGTPTTGIISYLNNQQNINLDHNEILSLKYQHFLALIDTVQPVKAVVDIAKQYHNRIPIAVGTGGARPIAEKTLKIFGLDSLFSVMVCAEDVTAHKPAPDTFLLCADLMGVSAKDCHVFEDGDQGIKAAITAGMTYTGCTRDGCRATDEQEKPGEYTLKSLKEIWLTLKKKYSRWLHILFRKSKEKQRIMLVPHSGKKILTFHIANYSIFIAIAVLVFLVIFSILSLNERETNITQIASLATRTSSHKQHLKLYKHYSKKAFHSLRPFFL